MVLSQWLLTDTLELILILLLSGLVLERQSASNLANPWRLESKGEVLSQVLLDNLLAWWHDLEAFLLAKLGLIEHSHNLPLLGGVVHDWDVLSNEAACRHSELELGADLLRNGCELVLVKADVRTINRLQDNVASVAGRLGRVAVQLEQVLVRVEVLVGDVLLVLAVGSDCALLDDLVLGCSQIGQQDA